MTATQLLADWRTLEIRPILEAARFIARGFRTPRAIGFSYDQQGVLSVAFVALQMNDVARASAYRSAVDAAYPGTYPYPWYCAESGWYLRVIDGLLAPQTVAAD